MKTPKLTRKAQLAMIEEYFWRLHFLMDSTGHYWANYLDEIATEERQHRRGCPDGVKCGLSVKQSLRLFAVSYIMEYRAGKPAPPVEQILHWRPTVFKAYGLYTENRVKLDAEFTVAEAMAFAAVDYAELNKDPRQ